MRVDLSLARRGRLRTAWSSLPVALAGVLASGALACGGADAGGGDAGGGPGGGSGGSGGSGGAPGGAGGGGGEAGTGGAGAAGGTGGTGATGGTGGTGGQGATGGAGGGGGVAGSGGSGGSAGGVVRGRFLRDWRPSTAAGLGATRAVPVRGAVLHLIRSTDDVVISTGATDDDGRFELAWPADAPAYVTLLSRAAVPWRITVKDCPEADCPGGGDLYGVSTDLFSPAAEVLLPELVVTEELGAGAFQVLDVLARGATWARDLLGEIPPALTGQFRAGSETVCGTSCFWSPPAEIYVASPDWDPDEWDDTVLLHEFGHFVEQTYSRADSWGGDHDGSPTDPVLAWSEGWATWAGCAMAGTSLYVDSATTGATALDFALVETFANPRGGLQQLVSEYLVAESLWALAAGPSGLGDGAVMDVMTQYLPGASFADRGVTGADLVDFLDGWMCLGVSGRPLLESVIVDDHAFPYDFAGPASCPAAGRPKPRAPVVLSLSADPAADGAIRLVLDVLATADVPAARARFALPEGATVRRGALEQPLGALIAGERTQAKLELLLPPGFACPFTAGVDAQLSPDRRLHRAAGLRAAHAGARFPAPAERVLRLGGDTVRVRRVGG